jgi:hypothetical protein
MIFVRPRFEENAVKGAFALITANFHTPQLCSIHRAFCNYDVNTHVMR